MAVTHFTKRSQSIPVFDLPLQSSDPQEVAVGLPPTKTRAQSYSAI